MISRFGKSRSETKSISERKREHRIGLEGLRRMRKMRVFINVCEVMCGLGKEGGGYNFQTNSCSVQFLRH